MAGKRDGLAAVRCRAEQVHRAIRRQPAGLGFPGVDPVQRGGVMLHLSGAQRTRNDHIPVPLEDGPLLRGRGAAGAAAC
jgi:hypothetical protein